MTDKEADEASMASEKPCYQLAAYIVAFLRNRNGGELNDAISGISMSGYEQLLEELSLILHHQGKPPNWIK